MHFNVKITGKRKSANNAASMPPFTPPPPPSSSLLNGIAIDLEMKEKNAHMNEKQTCVTHAVRA